MALLNDDVKPNFDTTLSANFDENDDGTGLNPQPLRVNNNGDLIVTIDSGGVIVTSGNIVIEGINTFGVQQNVACDNLGALNQGGVNLSTLSDGEGNYVCLSRSAQSATYQSATASIATLRNQLAHDCADHNYTKMYNYSENISVIGTNIFYVFVSCYAGN